MEYHSLPRKELQSLCKKHGIPANMTNVAMADALQSLNIAQDSETGIPSVDAVILTTAALTSPASVMTSCRRTPLRTHTRSMARTTRSRREAEKEQQPKSPAAGGLESLVEAEKASPNQFKSSQTVAPSGRRIMTRSSSQRQMEKIEIGRELLTPAKVVISSVQSCRRRSTRASAQPQTRQKEEKEVLEKLKSPPVASRAYSTRRSARLRGKNQDSEVKQLGSYCAEEKLEKKFIDEIDIKQPDAATELSSTSGPCDSELQDLLVKPDQEMCGELSGKPSINMQESSSMEDGIKEVFVDVSVETPASGSDEHKEGRSGQITAGIPAVNETTCLMEQSDQNVLADEEYHNDAGAFLCSVEVSRDIPAIDEASSSVERLDRVTSNEVLELFPEREAPAGEGEKPVIDDVSASLNLDAGGANVEQGNAPLPYSLEVLGESPSSGAAPVAVGSDEASAPVTDDVSASLNLEAGGANVEECNTPVPYSLEVLGEPLSIGATPVLIGTHEASSDAILFSTGASDEAQVVGQTTRDPEDLAKEELQQIVHKVEIDCGSIVQEANLNVPHFAASETEDNVGEPLPSADDCSNIPGSNNALQFPGTAPTDAQKLLSANVHHDSVTGEQSGITAAVFPDAVSGEFQQIEETNDKSPSFGSWSARCPVTDSPIVGKSGKSSSIVGGSKEEALNLRQVFMNLEVCVDKENKMMNEANIVVDKANKMMNEANIAVEKENKKLNEQNNVVDEFHKFSLRKLRMMVKEKEGSKNKVQMNQRAALETLSGNCLLGNENREMA